MRPPQRVGPSASLWLHPIPGGLPPSSSGFPTGGHRPPPAPEGAQPGAQSPQPTPERVATRQPSPPTGTRGCPTGGQSPPATPERVANRRPEPLPPLERVVSRQPSPPTGTRGCPTGRPEPLPPLGACCLKAKRLQATIFDLRRQRCARHLLLIVEPCRLMGSAIPPTLWVGGLLLIPLPLPPEPSGSGTI